MPKVASDERRRFWLGLVERQPRSGLNITQFCAQAGVSQNSFHVWKRRLRAMVQESRPAPRRRGQRKALAKSPSLVPVRLIPDLDLRPSIPQVIEVAWPDGVVLRIPPGCDSQTLRAVFGLLRSARKDEILTC